MNSDQYAEWFHYHSIAFRGFADWWAKSPDQRTAQAIWFRLLKDVELADARAATDAILAGEVEEPMGYDRHVRAIVAYARSHRTLRLAACVHEAEPDFHDAVRCLECKDAGRVIVWSLRSMEAAVRGNLGLPGTLYTTGVPCVCSAGDMPARQDAARLGIRDETRVRFNPSRMFVAPWCLTGFDEQAKLREFVELLRSALKPKAWTAWEPA